MYTDAYTLKPPPTTSNLPQASGSSPQVLLSCADLKQSASTEIHRLEARAILLKTKASFVAQARLCKTSASFVEMVVRPGFDCVVPFRWAMIKTPSKGECSGSPEYIRMGIYIGC